MIVTNLDSNLYTAQSKGNYKKKLKLKAITIRDMRSRKISDFYRNYHFALFEKMRIFSGLTGAIPGAKFLLIYSDQLNLMIYS